MPDANTASHPPDEAALAALAAGTHGDPFALLGPHGGTLRVLAPGAAAVRAVAPRSGETLALLQPSQDGVLFTGPLESGMPYLLQIDWHGAEQLTEDPYSFGPLLSEFDLYLLGEGRHRDLGQCLGAHAMTIADTAGVRFAVWAPNARRVSVVGGFNNWDGRRHPMRARAAGIWEIFIPRIGPGEVYKYEILGPHGILPLKADPVAAQSEIPPATGSIVADPALAPPLHPPLRRTQTHDLNRPLSIYEVHAASWMRHHDGTPYRWDELATRLIPYAVDLGFTHIELLPIMGHPFGGSWGYQPLSQFAPMPQMGSPQDFARFVDACHAAGLGLILDWVPAHFPTDTHGLAQFDGTPLYEHADPREGFHNDWNTLIYNLGRFEVRGFLIASALYWLEHFGVDGIRVDAVASMLYRDYSRKAGEWVPNIYGGRENLESIAFLQELSSSIMERCPGALLIAEESTAFPGVTRVASEGGLGFTHKWNMGWMHDTLNYMAESPINRRHHHDKLTFGLVYAFTEHFVLPISHDEVVHGKASLINKMPGDEWQKFASLRAYLGFMWTQPGKKLLFMGCEFGQTREWNHDAELSWDLLQHNNHRGVQGALRALNHLHRTEPALYAHDFDAAGFTWVIGDDRDQSVIAYLRHGNEGDKPLLVICNFTPVPRHHYRIGVPGAAWREVFNSDNAGFGGSDLGNAGLLRTASEAMHGQPGAIALTLPPLATIILRQEEE
jgi:1,4-alpha-glucan branching enzyme